MKCQVCGQEYGVAHSCAGRGAAPDVFRCSGPPRICAGTLLGEALRIATGNDGAIRRPNDYPNAIVYCVIILHGLAVFAQLPCPFLRLLAAGRVSSPVIVASSVAILLWRPFGSLDFLK